MISRIPFINAKNVLQAIRTNMFMFTTLLVMSDGYQTFFIVSGSLVYLLVSVFVSLGEDYALIWLLLCGSVFGTIIKDDRLLSRRLKSINRVCVVPPQLE